MESLSKHICKDYEKLITGKQFEGARRKIQPLEILKEGIKFLKIKCYLTYFYDCRDIPRKIERELIAAFKMENNGMRPGIRRIDSRFNKITSVII